MNPKRTALAVAAAVAIAAAAPAGAEFSYNYLEFHGDLSLTDNTAQGATDDASGSLAGVELSFGVVGPLYVKGGFSVENKDFENEIAAPGHPSFGTVALGTRQTFLSLGIGLRFEAGENTDFFGELLWMDTEVDHDLPCVNGLDPEKCLRVSELGAFFQDPMARPSGRPTASTIPGLLEDTGYGVRIGFRRRLGERTEIGANLGLVDIVDERETSASGSLRYYLHDNLAIGGSLTFARSTDANFDNIRKAGLSLRVAF